MRSNPSAKLRRSPGAQFDGLTGLVRFWSLRPVLEVPAFLKFRWRLLFQE
jgi:hypothetical protein